MKYLYLKILLVLGPIIFHFGYTQDKFIDELKNSKKFKETTDILDTWIQAVLDYDRLPGASIAIVYNQDIIYTKGYGYSDINKEIKATEDTYYCIGSVSKQFTAMAIMQLRDSGKLKLSDPVTKYLPWFNPVYVDTDATQPTIRDILLHTSGLSCEPSYTQDPQKTFLSHAELIETVKNIKMSYPRNVQHNYSNLGYALLGEIISVVSKTDYYDYIKNNILDPINLKNTTPNCYDEKFRDKLGKSYGMWPRYGERKELTISDWKAMIPAGGFGSTVTDLAQFIMWQFRVIDGKDTEILSQETLKEMQSVQWDNPKWGYAFTYWYLGELDLIGHQGGTFGYQTQIIFSPEEKIGVIIILNANDAPKWRIAMESYDIISQGFKKVNNNEIETNVGKWKEYTGYYSSDDTWADLEVIEWDGDINVMGLPPYRLLSDMTKLSQIEKDIFREVWSSGSLGKHYVFGRGTDNRIQSIKFNNNILFRSK